MTLYSVRILWITCLAVVSYALPTTNKNASLTLKNVKYLEDLAGHETALKEVLKTVMTEINFPDLGVKGHQRPLWRDYIILSDDKHVENTSLPSVKENVEGILPASDTSKDEDVEISPTSDNVDVENTPPTSVNSNIADILPDFNNADVENTSPEDRDVGNTPHSDNDDDMQTSLSDNEDVEITSSPSDGDVENTSLPSVKENVEGILPASDTSKDEDVEISPTSDNVDVENTPPTSVNSNIADILPDFNNADVENTSPEDRDVGNTPHSDNKDDVQTSLSDNEDVENTSSPSDEDVENTSSPSDEDVETTSLPSDEDVGGTDLCANATIDTITRTKSGSTYVFKGDFYWEVLPNGIAENYPRKISDDWDGLEGNLDASVTWHNGKTFFFKGKKYWRFTDKKMDPHYPNLISVGFKGIPDDLDAAFVWSGNGKTYFYKANQYWRFDLDADPPARKGYPKSISAWGHVLADGVDAAFQWENGRTYIFKGDKYYRYNDGRDKIDVGYPLSTPEEWFNCRNQKQNQKQYQKQNTTTQAQDMGELINEYREHLNTYRH